MSEYTDEDVRSAVAFVPVTSIGMRFSDAEAEKFDRWLAAHDAEVRASVVSEEPDWEYGVGWRHGERLIAFSTKTRAAAEKYIDAHPADLDFGAHLVVQRQPERAAGPWLPVEQEGETDA